MEWSTLKGLRSQFRVSSCVSAVEKILEVDPAAPVSCPRWFCLEPKQGVPGVLWLTEEEDISINIMKISPVLDKMSVREPHWPCLKIPSKCPTSTSLKYYATVQGLSYVRNFLHPQSLFPSTFWAWVGGEMSKYVRKHRSALRGRREVNLVYFPKYRLSFQLRKRRSMNIKDC